jgi:hypothetical protein
LAKSLRHDALIRPLTIALGDDLSSDTISCILIGSIMRFHVNMAAGSWRERLQQFQVDLRIVHAHKGTGNQSSAAQMFPNKGINSIVVLESIKQRRKAFGLIVQRKHRLIHKHKGAVAGFGQNSSLGDPILADCQF